MSAAGGSAQARPQDAPAARESTEAPGRLGDDLADILDAAERARDRAGPAARALRALLRADLAVARASVGRGALLIGLALVVAMSACFLLVASGVALAHRAGLSWTASMLLVAVITAVLALLLLAWGRRTLRGAQLQATRRQLDALLGRDEG